MSKRKKILIWIGAIIIALVGSYYLFMPGIISLILSSEPRDPKLEIAETYQIGWWSNQESMTIDSFEVEMVENKLNLFNDKSLISYKVKGKLKSDKNWKPYIKKIHISQRFIRVYNRDLHPYLETDTAKIPEAIIEITPVIKVKKDENYSGELIDFEFINEIKLESFHWGNNWVRFKCGAKNEDLILKQRK